MESHEQDEVVGRSKMCPRERAAGMKVGMGGCLQQRSRGGEEQERKLLVVPSVVVVVGQLGYNCNDDVVMGF